MIDIDSTIIAYREEKEKRFRPYIDHIKMHHMGIIKEVKTSFGMVNITLYRSEQAASNAPVYFNFHGGGFVLGFYELDGPYCQLLAQSANCTVINVDYLLAPEHKFPDGINSSCEVVAWCLNHAIELEIDPTRFVLGGHSAGGNLAIGLTRLLLDKGYEGIKGLLVDYAPCDQELEHPECLEQVALVEHNRNLQYMSWYFHSVEELHHPLASPCHQEVADFPETFMIVAEHDPLRVGGEKFKSHLRRNHIPVEFHCFMGCDHGFTHEYYDEYQEVRARDAWIMMSEFLKKCLK